MRIGNQIATSENIGMVFHVCQIKSARIIAVFDKHKLHLSLILRVTIWFPINFIEVRQI
jgi:hypothetical protein